MIASALPWLADLPDLDKIRDILRRVQEMLVMGGVALALAASLLFLLAWVASHLRRPSASVADAKPVLSWLAFGSAALPVALTVVAALGVVLPVLTPFVLKSFAIAVVLAAATWCLAVATIVLGGSRADLARARRALLLAGTPWYCLAVYLATYL